MKARPITALILFASAVLFSLSQVPLSLGDEIEYHRTPGSLFERYTTVLFGGDMMFDRYIRQTMDSHGGNFIFSCIAETLGSADLVVMNLEGPITEYPSVSLGSEAGEPNNFIFTFPTEIATLLARYNIRLVSLGNNHTLNLGWEGMHSTRAALRAARVGYFGAPSLGGLESDSFDGASKIENINGVSLAFINYNEFAPEGWRVNAESARAQIVEARKHRYLPIVYTHWGNEYATISLPRQRVLAHDFVDAGAEMVIGSHPHVIEENELYNDKHIYYSLGNFIFDQYWDDNVRTGLLLRVTFTSRSVASVEEIPVELFRDGRTCLKETRISSTLLYKPKARSCFFCGII